MKVTSENLDRLQSHLSQLRALLEFTQTDLAYELGVSKTTIYNWEQNKVAMSKLSYLAMISIINKKVNESSDPRLAKIISIILGGDDEWRL